METPPLPRATRRPSRGRDPRPDGLTAPADRVHVARRWTARLLCPADVAVDLAPTDRRERSRPAGWPAHLTGNALGRTAGSESTSVDAGDNRLVGVESRADEVADRRGFGASGCLLARWAEASTGRRGGGLLQSAAAAGPASRSTRPHHDERPNRPPCDGRSQPARQPPETLCQIERFQSPHDLLGILHVVPPRASTDEHAE